MSGDGVAQVAGAVDMTTPGPPEHKAGKVPGAESEGTPLQPALRGGACSAGGASGIQGKILMEIEWGLLGRD